MLNASTVNRSRRSGRATGIVAVLASCLLIFLGWIRISDKSAREIFGPPHGWFLAGDHPQNYISGVDRKAIYEGHPSAYLKAKPSANEGFGTLMQQFDAKEYVGQRVRMSAWVKSEGVEGWAGLWMRVDGGSKSLAFDNMQNRPITGTTDWQNYAVVLDVPKEATGMFFGVLLNKKGNVWLNSVKFETVGDDVQVTDMWAARGNAGQHQAPTNLNFEE